MVARRAHNPKVAGSNPAPATKKAQVRLYVGPGLRRSRARLLTELLTDFAAATAGNRRSLTILDLMSLRCETLTDVPALLANLMRRLIRVVPVIGTRREISAAA